jgi:hypothetical protein
MPKIIPQIGYMSSELPCPLSLYINSLKKKFFKGGALQTLLSLTLIE